MEVRRGIRGTFHRVTDTHTYGSLPRVWPRRMSRRNLGSRIAFQMTAFEPVASSSLNAVGMSNSFILIYCAPRG